MQYLGIDWSYRRAAWCALSERGAMVGKGAGRRGRAGPAGHRAWSGQAAHVPPNRRYERL
jgi:hypothetical protein